jgi:NAD(P)-dependent dehydrogenase (short-subunit alcohol dehydrogenase family)
MKRQWYTEELSEYWMLQPQEQKLLLGKTDSNRLAFILLLKFFQHEGCFPHQRQEIPKVVQDFVAQSLGVSGDILQDYDWLGRTAKRYRSQIRSYLGFREATAEDSIHLRQWLVEEILSQEQEEDGLTTTSPSYCLSKLALNGATIMLSQSLSSKDIVVNSMCPGWVRTDMGGASAPRLPEQGADTAIWLATEAPRSQSGKFFRDRKVIPF